MFDSALQFMTRFSKDQFTFLAILLVAAVLEVMGDVAVSKGLQHKGLVRIAIVLAGGAVLLGYSLLINATGRELTPMLVTYVACFFFVSLLWKPSEITPRSASALVLVAIAAWLCWPGVTEPRP